MVLGKICNADNVGNVFLPTATHFKPDYTEDENLTSFKTQNMNLRCWKRSLEKICSLNVLQEFTVSWVQQWMVQLNTADVIIWIEKF